MDEEKQETFEIKPFFAKCAIIQAISVAVIIIFILGLKYISPEYFGKLQKWYEKNVTVNTSVTEVLGDKDEV